MIHYIFNRLRMQRDLRHFDRSLKKIAKTNHEPVLKLLFEERSLLYRHCDLIITKNVHLNEIDLYKMNEEIDVHKKTIETFINCNSV